MADHTELFKQFSDNDSFRRWLSDEVFAATYSEPAAAASASDQSGRLSPPSAQPPPTES